MKLKKRLAAFTELPESVFGGCSYIEIESNSSVKVNGCIKIIDYCSERVVLLTREFELNVSGEGLTLVSYGESTAAVNGKICAVTLGGEEKC